MDEDKDNQNDGKNQNDGGTSAAGSEGTSGDEGTGSEPKDDGQTDPKTESSKAVESGEPKVGNVQDKGNVDGKPGTTQKVEGSTSSAKAASVATEGHAPEPTKVKPDAAIDDAAKSPSEPSATRRQRGPKFLWRK